MTTNQTQHKDARKARDSLLARASWIIEANILAACGHVPVLPSDMEGFLPATVDPDPKALASLLKAVMPAITLADDRRKSPVHAGLTPLQEAAQLLEAQRRGDISPGETNAQLVLLGKFMDMDERMKLVDFVNNYQARLT